MPHSLMWKMGERKMIPGSRSFLVCNKNFPASLISTLVEHTHTILPNRKKAFGNDKTGSFWKMVICMTKKYKLYFISESRNSNGSEAKQMCDSRACLKAEDEIYSVDIEREIT